MTVERIGEQSELRPVKELRTEDGFEWKVYDFGTGIRELVLEDLQTGVCLAVPLVNTETRVAAHKAWLGARQSRSPDTPWQILWEMEKKGVDPDQKLDDMFTTYGHKSVGDMARLQIGFVNIPIHLCTIMFLDMATNSGQEKSTRYQKKFMSALLHSIRHYFEGGKIVNFEVLEKEYQSLGELSLQLFEKYRGMISDLFVGKYQPEQGQKGSLDSRALDWSRCFLLWGMSTGMEVETSARDWSRVIADFKSSNVSFYQRIGRHIERLLTPSAEEEMQLGFKAEAPTLIRHTEADNTTNQSLARLREHVELNTDFLERVPREHEFTGAHERSLVMIDDRFTVGERMLSQYLQTLYPGADFENILAWTQSLGVEQKKQISKIILGLHNNYKEPPYLARVTKMTTVLRTYIAIARDWLRHRSSGRVMSIPQIFGERLNYDTAKQVIAKGFVLPVYSTEVPEFAQARDEFVQDMTGYYGRLSEFVDTFANTFGEDADHSFVMNLLPLAHQVDLWMNWDPKAAQYSTHQRIRPGGDMTYRVDAFEMNNAIADSDPLLEGMRLPERPDPNNRKEFFDRG